MSYRHLGAMPANPFADPTFAFAAAVDPYTPRTLPPGSMLQPYGWGPGFAIGMPARYAHHIDYVRTPVPGTYDTLRGVHGFPTPALAGLAGVGLAALPLLAVL